MDKQIWIDHLLSWKKFLTERLNSTNDDGEKIKCDRQIKTIERVRCGAVLNPALLLEFKSPSDENYDEAPCLDYYCNLNESQKKAVRLALGSSVLSLIQGPPGTGKTQVIAEICLQLFNINPNIRILVCSETHVAVNNLLLRISNHSKNIRILRIRDKEKNSVDQFSPESIIEEYLKWASRSIQAKEAYGIIENELKTFDEIPSKKNQVEKALILSANVIGMTCNRVAAYNFDTTEIFDIVIIDEVCKATLPEILSPLAVSQKAVLIGDPKQLPPVFCSEEQEVIKSIENCNLNKFMYIDSLFEERKKVSTLDTQYRMSNQIGSMISNLFYNGLLKNGRNKDIVNSLTWVTYSPSREWPIKEKINLDKPQVFNNDEVGIIDRLLRKIIVQIPKNQLNQTTIAIIAPYRAQVLSLRKRCLSLNSEFVKIDIDTVDGFQGKESDIVIFSVTRTSGSYRFLADDRRLNVALSRAKDKLYIIGNCEYAKKQKLLNKIINNCNINMMNF